MINVNLNGRGRTLCSSAVRVELVRLGRRVRPSRLAVAAAVVGLGGVTGCGGYAITATNGTVFADATNVRAQVSDALIASASRDLPCTSELELRRLDADRLYEVSGCGERVRYDIETPSIRTRRVTLVEREAQVAKAATHPASPTPPASADAHPTLTAGSL